MKLSDRPQYDDGGVLLPPQHARHRHDRKDGWYIEDMDAFHKYFTHMNPKRSEDEVCLLDELDVTAVLEYLERRNRQHPENKATIFHAVLTAVAKLIYQRPALNRFVSGRRFYQRKQLVLSFVAKKRFADDAEEALMMLRPQVGDDINTLTAKVVGDVRQARTEADKGEGYGADKALETVGRFPRWLMMLVMWFFRKLDFYGLFPASFTEVDPNFSTVLLSNLGSIKCPAPYHHLSNFGTCSIMLTIGTIHKAQRLDALGQAHVRDVVDFGITLDERIGDGFYFSKCVRLLQYILDHPETLQEPVGRPVPEDFQLHG